MTHIHYPPVLFTGIHYPPVLFTGIHCKGASLMLGNMFTHTIHVPGTLAANIGAVFTVPVDCTLIHASAVGSNANNGLLILGTTSNDDAYLESASIGDSSVPAEFAQSNFVGGQFPRLLKGTVFSATLDFDGAGGTATQNFTLSLTFLEG